MSKWLNEKKLVLKAAVQMQEKGMVIGTSGNVSLRLPPQDGRELLAITPSSRYYEELTPDDIQVIDFETEPVEGDLAPSSETMLHIGIYQVRKNVNAVIHTHSVYATAMAVSHNEIPPITDDQMAFLGGEIRLAEYAPSGSDELVKNVIEALGDRNGVLMKNHGMLGAGRSMHEALTACEMVEKTARVYYLSLTAGTVNLLTAEAVQSGRAVFRALNQ